MVSCDADAQQPLRVFQIFQRDVISIASSDDETQRIDIREMQSLRPGESIFIFDTVHL